MMQELEKDLRERSEAKGIYLHMHVVNKVGLKFYLACDFQEVERLENYYTDLEEPHCLILKKAINRDAKPNQTE